MVNHMTFWYLRRKLHLRRMQKSHRDTGIIIQCSVLYQINGNLVVSIIKENTLQLLYNQLTFNQFLIIRVIL